MSRRAASIRRSNKGRWRFTRGAAQCPTCGASSGCGRTFATVRRGGRAYVRGVAVIAPFRRNATPLIGDYTTTIWYSDGTSRTYPIGNRVRNRPIRVRWEPKRSSKGKSWAACPDPFHEISPRRIGGVPLGGRPYLWGEPVPVEPPDGWPLRTPVLDVEHELRRTRRTRRHRAHQGKARR